MGLTFYPIEDSVVLQAFRQQFCPFMKAVQKTTNTEITDSEIESICSEIIETARSNQINNQLSREWFDFIRAPLNKTLGKEHDNLIATNLQ